MPGKVALITGAGSGLGRGCAIKLAKNGVNVVIADVNVEAATRVANEIKVLGGSAYVVEMDVSSEESVEAGIRECVEVYGSIDILVSNAGIQIVHPIEEFPFEEWKKMMAIHADGAFLTSRAAYRYMKASGKGGKIIFMGSAHSHVGSKLKSPYCFAKHGLLGLCRVLAKEGAEYGIHTYVVCPG
ncbi:MAG: SDR family NAD(P)-dependent oxidoreductase, partial [Firmicutes bacterium]|nr:SDR family NAD(P)-dependent oxidoreductase [Bacillota bacterium]